MAFAMVLLAALGGIVWAAAPKAAAPKADAPRGPRPNDTAIPVVSSEAAAQAALDQAKKAAQALVADLTLGQEGELVRAATAEALPPGRYRLHALVASTPHNHILAEAVALRLTAGEATNVFDPQKWFPDSNVLSAVRLDVVVPKAGPLTVTAGWLVGDSKLDRQQHRDEGEARRVYRDQRQNAINKAGLKVGPSAGLTDEREGDDAVPDVMKNDESLCLRPRAITAKNLPAYRLLLAGMVIERTSPVAVVAVRTDKPAYEPNAVGSATVQLHNYSTEAVTARLEWTVEDDAHPGKTASTHTETVTLAANEEKDHVFAEPLATAGIERLGRVRVAAAVESLRTDATHTPFVILPAPVKQTTDRTKKVFAHYMGCYPAGTGPTRSHRLDAGKNMKHESTDDVTRRGGRFRNYDLTPYDANLTAEESADLEIRRALRIGINGFAVDAWAGGDGAKQVFDALIKVAEAKDYPFEVTVCLDPACGGDPVGTVREVLDRWGKSPKLARRDGKPLVFSYFSHGFAMGTLQSEVDQRLVGAQREAAVNRLRTTELGWHLIGQTFRKAAEQVGQPVYFQYDLCYFFHPIGNDLVKPGMMTAAAGAIARHVGAMGSFGGYGFGYGDRTEDIARAIRDAGAEWGGVGGMHQKENIFAGGGEIFMPKGTEWLRGVWSDTRRDSASLVQLITWNDYTENTAIAPAYNTRYTIYDLTGFYIDWWRRGEEPKPDHDRVYLTYAKYPKDAKSWPFAISVRSNRALEVLTILTAPATVRLPGRDIEYQAPAGLHVEQFPIKAGEVIAEVVRDGKVAVHIQSPEPITDRPFREDNAMVCFSTEFERHWKADFGDKPPLLYSEYGDLNNDGLPNWFKMYWFTRERNFKPVESDDILPDKAKHPVTKWLDMSTVTLIDPNALTPSGKTVRQAYLDRTDPTMVPTGKAPNRNDLTDEPASE